ncbi:PEP-CTERM sorting domain-containing protein [Pontixanthobacter sp. CEM42]|nr:PEP-CTERM sorting domain-containing protein [Pontixanthobacter sp. CEM42]
MLAVVASPAYASGGTQVPEPSNLALFGLGLTGLIVGRLMAKRKNQKSDD